MPFLVLVITILTIGVFDTIGALGVFDGPHESTVAYGGNAAILVLFIIALALAFRYEDGYR